MTNVHPRPCGEPPGAHDIGVVGNHGASRSLATPWIVLTLRA